MLKTTAFFDSLCKNAKHNAIIVMDTTGIILDVNEAFLHSFGYNRADVLQKNFSMLFTAEDKKMKKPEIEIQKANAEGSGSDDNFLVQKSGKTVWVNGESILVTDEENTSYIVKIIHNISAQKQLERFLLQSNDFIEEILDSITDRALIIIDASMKVVKVNSTFLEMFDLTKPPAEDSRISNIGHHFWASPPVKEMLRDILVKDKTVQDVAMQYITRNNQTRPIAVTSKFLHSYNADKRILLSIKAL